MKKYNVFKILTISILVTVVLSFLIPQTSFDNYGNLSKGSINPISIIDSFANGLTSLGVFLNAFVYILCIGIFYFVLKKTKKYDETITNTAYMFRNKKVVFNIISICTFAIVTAITSDVMPMLIFIPAFIDISKKLGYDSKISILTTIGSIILGSSASLYTNYANQILGSVVGDNILFKIIILLITIVSLIVFTVVFGKTPEDTKLEKVGKKSVSFISISFDIILVLILLGMTSWSSYFGFNGFTELHSNIANFKIFNVSPFISLIGASVAALGSWTVFDLSVLLLILSLISAIVYRVKFDELLQSVAEGIKKSLPYALIIVIANIVLVNVYNSGFFYTILTGLAKMSDKLFSSAIISMLASFVYPDYTYASQFTLSTITAVASSTEFNIVLALIFQAIYSLFLLIMPTSILLLMGLRYTNVRYKDWFKFIFKYVIVLLAFIFTILFVASINFIGIPSIIFLIIISIIGYALLIVSLVLKFSSKTVVVEPKKEEIKVETKTEEVKKEEPKKQATQVKKPTTKKKTTNKKSKK